jgi:hypothetical protein
MQLGKAIGILLRAYEAEAFMHEDVDAFHAPSECHALVARGEAKRLRQARRHAEAVAGMNLRGIRKLARKRMGNDAPIYRRYGMVPY